MENLENEFNKLQSTFNEGKKYLIGKNKDIKLSIQSYEKYLLNLEHLYENLKNNSNINNYIDKLNSVYIVHIIKLVKIFLLIPYYYKAKLLCEKVLEIDKNNIEILPSYIKCLHYFRKYELITEILNNIKSEENEKIKELKLKNIDRIKESKGEYDLKTIFQNFKKNNNYNLDLAEYTSNNICIQKDKLKGLVLLAKEEIPKGTMIIASKAIEYVPKNNDNLIKIYYQKEEYQKKLITKIIEKMNYCKEDIPEIYELYDKTNSELSLEERKQNYYKNISKKSIDIPEKNLSGIFSNAIATKLYLFDELDLLLGIFYYPSFMSHSCIPNTKILGIGNFIFIFTERLIKKNEEITTSYIDCNEEYNKRQEKLKKFYGFECQCELCLSEKKKFQEIPEIKNKISFYINELIDLINNPNFEQKKYLDIANEITKFVDDNNNNISNYEKGILFYNLFCLWPYNDSYLKNYNLLKNGLESLENEKIMQFNILKYNYLLKMYKVNYVFNEKLKDEIRQKMIILFSEVLGNKEKEFIEILLDDLINFYTKNEDREIKGLKLIKFKIFL